MDNKVSNFDPGKHTLFKNTRYALYGLIEVVKNERAFKLELILFFVLSIVALLLPVSHTSKLILILVLFFPLIIELLNSAIERVVDLASPEYHQLAKHAKDAASAAVFMSITLVVFVWLFFLLVMFDVIS
jgi:diacylglycerol kinase (ATP)